MFRREQHQLSVDIGIMFFMVEGTDTSGQVAWLALVVDERKRRSNDGYDDDPATHYSWDDTVPNRDALQPGHVLVLWNTKTSLGVSVIENITRGTATKSIYRCQGCGGANFEQRKTMTPIYRCYSCKAEFDQPVETSQEVRTYRSEHSRAWVDLYGTLTGDQLRSLCERPKAQNSLRRLDWPRFQHTIDIVEPGLRLTAVRVTVGQIAGGHKRAVVRVRIGQRAFRQQLLRRYGNVCAFTGSTPPTALEAAHLYSYAASGRHEDDGGFLLRRDLHTLFDCGLLAVRPDTNRIDVSPELHGYPQYAILHGTLLNINLSEKHRRFLTQHWAMHRPVLSKRP